MGTTLPEQLNWLDTERAWVTHSPPDTGVDPRRSKAGRLRLSVRLMSPLPYPASLQVTTGPPAVPYRFTAPSFSWDFGCLQPLAWPLIRLAGASLPPELLRSPNGASVTMPCPCRPAAALHLAPLRPPAVGFGRCRQSRVSGKRSQTLNA